MQIAPIREGCSPLGSAIYDLLEAATRLLVCVSVPLGCQHLAAAVISTAVALLIPESTALAHVLVPVADAGEGLRTLVRGAFEATV